MCFRLRCLWRWEWGWFLKLELKDSFKESYVFVTSGFYHGLRTYLYPEADASDSYKKRIEEYVDELEQFLNHSIKH